jgi:hypothetical protein
MHNVAMAKYGSAWNPSWRHLDGDGEIVWGPGSELSEKGREQARVSRRETFSVMTSVPCRFPWPLRVASSIAPQGWKAGY